MCYWIVCDRGARSHAPPGHPLACSPRLGRAPPPPLPTSIPSKYTELAALDARLESLRAEQKRLTARLADLGAVPRTSGAALDAHVRLRGGQQ